MKLLLHTCCAPCLSGAHKAMDKKNIDITPFFYNPNIHPAAEMQRRSDAMRKF